MLINGNINILNAKSLNESIGQLQNIVNNLKTADETYKSVKLVLI